ncbi:LacI family DNA-binding transcriptional regulator [Candidatus Poriferisodalis sp.]|uniref:LacI family DNA-binding transcriptional regulator n=1 Tax=Candidatus Poriferisodalis sp. TaxID=3101277 RepID=UPI003B01DFCF
MVPDKRANSRHRIRLADVAAHVGVSRSTASLVLRSSPLVAEETSIKVLQACKELGYVYNRAASSLRAQRTHSVGLVVTSVGNPFFAELVDGVESALAVSGRTAILGQHSENLDSQEALLNRLMEAGVDGVILTAAYGTDAETLRRLTSAGVAVVSTARRLAGVGEAYVGPDNHSGARAAAQHVVSLHEPASVVFVGGSPAGSPFAERLSGIQDGLAGSGRSPEEVTAMPCKVSRHDAHEAAIELLDRTSELPVAVFAYNDVVALGVASAARERGMTIGRDVLLVGFDDIEAARFEQPPLTTVRIGVADMGRAAAELLVAMIDGNNTETERTIIPSLVIRRSCGCDVDDFIVEAH